MTNLRPGFRDLIGQFESTCSNTNAKFTVPCTLSRVHIVSVPDPKPTPARIGFSITCVILEVIYALEEVWGRD